MKQTKKLDAPEYYINRELSWLEFNQRVLEEGLDQNVPLLERLKFLAIVSSNLDEFFMVRVAGLRQQRQAHIRLRDISGLTPNQQLQLIARRVHQMVQDQSAGINSALEQLHNHGLHIVGPNQWTAQQNSYLQNFFTETIMPVLTPVAVREQVQPPLIPGLQLNVILLLTLPGTSGPTSQIVVVPVPGTLPRFITIPTEPPTKEIYLAPLESIIVANIGALFPKGQVLSTAVFRITRDADLNIQDDESNDLLQTVEHAITARNRRSAVRLTLSAQPDRRLRSWLLQALNLRSEEIYEIDGLLDPSGLMEIAQRPGFDNLKYPPWPPQPAEDLMDTEDIWKSIHNRDILLFHPYESFEPVVQLLTEAANDTTVLAIKQTLYRTSGDSPVVHALQKAAENGKQVTVLVELKARFDEARNITWARRLEDAGCLVIYGIAGYKTHSKALLIVRREGARVRRYVHLATGNYNDKTAKLYTDMGLMTCDNKIAGDVAAFFNLLTGYSEVVGWSDLTIAPMDLRRKFLELIDREIQTSTPEQPGLIMAKVNSLQDKQICQALYRASMAGVKIRLNVRGICCLRPGMKKISRNIEVRSIIDRFLEHQRMFFFRNGGHEEIYLSSADWMTRNLDKRLEILFPIKDPDLRQRLIQILEVYFADNVKARVMLPDGSYKKLTPDGRPTVRAQEIFYQQARDTARQVKNKTVRFRPISRSFTL